MARKSFDDATLAWLREMPLTDVLQRLRDDGHIFWRYDQDFVPVKNSRTERLFVSNVDGQAWELLITGFRWFDTRGGSGGGGGIDLVMHLLGVDFVSAVKIISTGAVKRPVGFLSR